MTKFVVTRDEKTLWRERGFADATAGRDKKIAGFPSPIAHGSYIVGYRIGAENRLVAD